MSEYRKTTTDELFFVTLSVVGWIDLFTRSIYKDIIVQNLQYCQQKENLEIYCYVIMTNHLHLICRRYSLAGCEQGQGSLAGCEREQKDLTELLGRFKSFTSKELLKTLEKNPQESRKEWILNQFHLFAKQNKQYSNYHLWQYANHPTLLYSNEIILQKQNYIHENPVRAGIVTDASAYLYSSACLESPLKVLEL